MRDDLNGSFDALPLHEEGGVFPGVFPHPLGTVEKTRANTWGPPQKRSGGRSSKTASGVPGNPGAPTAEVFVYTRASADADCPASVSTDVLADGTGRPVPGPTKNELRHEERVTATRSECT